MTRPLVYLDTETDGLRSDRRIWEVALILREDDESDEHYLTLLIEDVDLSNADPKALEIGRFEERFHRELLPHERRVREFQAAHILQEWTDTATIVGAQPWFDTHGITTLLDRHGLAPGWHYRQRCVESMTMGRVLGQVGGLVACAEALGLKVDDRTVHTAMGDALIVRDIWDLILDGETRPLGDLIT